MRIQLVSVRLPPLEFIGTLLVLISAAIQAPKSAFAEKTENPAGGTAVVYLIDNSTSMVWINEDVKAILKNVIKESTSGDSISIVFFGEKASTLASYKSIDENKKEILCRIIDTASATSLYTCFSPAIKKGVDLLHGYSRGGKAEKYVLLFVTDGKEHPPPDYVEECTLENALRQYPDFLPGKEWNLYYLALREQVDSELLSLVKKYDGEFFNAGELSQILNVSEEKIVESIIEDPHQWAALDTFVSDRFGEVEVKKAGEHNWVAINQARYKLLAGDEISVKKGAKAVVTIGSIARIGLGEETTIGLKEAESLPLKKKMNVRVELQNGTVLNSIQKPPDVSTRYEVLTPIALTGTRGTDFRVSYRGEIQEEVVSVFSGSVEISAVDKASFEKKVIIEAGNQSVIAAGNPPTPPFPIPQVILEEWNKWKKALLLKTPLHEIHFHPVTVRPLINQIVFGPIKPNQKYTAEIPLRYSEKYRGQHKISVLAQMPLPPGVELSTDVEDDNEDKLLKKVHLLLYCPPFLRHTGRETYAGNINLSCNSPDIKFTVKSIPVQVLQSRPNFAQRLRDLKPAIRNAVIVLSSLLLLLVIFVMWRVRSKVRSLYRLLLSNLKLVLMKTKLTRLYRGRPVGHFMLRSSASDQPQKKYDLAKISRESDSLILNIGSDLANPFPFTHSADQAIHCHIYAGRKRNPTKVFIGLAPGGKVVVNGETLKQGRQLKHKDMIQVGKLLFEFIDIQTQRQVRVHMNDGVQYTGMLEYWDLASLVFFMTCVRENKEQFLTLDFRDVLYVEFFIDESDPEKHILPRPLRRSRKLIRKDITVFLSNRKKLSGLVDRKYRYKQGAALFLLPLDKSNIQYIYVPGSSIKSVVIVDAQAKKK
ncbi:MAG: VWA domain-containing protein [Candidatus Abyssobacteria bacterium SURF_5]|uniref:VWA domain-containing protein n=1 Tax=Abyssobacteria bacterium (strain SURF_5) TaxID=2093360 RepID=A0A3A4P010_ABYX5|nr:MAG: VWA domain-containing protein [Candidatus Abyssubacteria bacterium SURF_5]